MPLAYFGHAMHDGTHSYRFRCFRRLDACSGQQDLASCRCMMWRRSGYSA